MSKGKQKLLAIIPARANSKQLKNKNVRILRGKPLISWTIESALLSDCIDTVVVSSDSDKILKIANGYRDVVTVKRPDNLATDVASSESVVLHVLEELKKKNLSFDTIMLLQPTSPLRDAQDIKNSLKLFEKQQSEALISVFEVENKLLKSFYQNGSCLDHVSSNFSKVKRRQDLPEIFMPNGAIYIVKTGSFMKHNNFFIPNGTIKYVMDESKSIDVDDINDLKKVRKILNNRHHESN